ncbi:hypothetical protein CH373_11200 [Leptospira perolatii]|uniref:Uncharacterized protein n=1 Tax=Leptospira perolatii TaxID=2023191 RepID=A0A2M9ZM36_9LEPT|nr:hypothetical protein [Leptospira perolatii]PJZ69731.1 hypothetical protein CH360_09035 [Leptospira perolatii]PJZ73054.1 hypothetical protein CH373_11200 [Leptospira perolatii]
MIFLHSVLGGILYGSKKDFPEISLPSLTTDFSQSLGASNDPVVEKAEIDESLSFATQMRDSID